MTVIEVLQLAHAAGVSISVDGDDLVLCSSRAPDPELEEIVRQHKTEILRLQHDHATWSEEDLQVLFDERAGIMEFDGGLSRDEAERLARQEVALLRRLAESSRG